MALIKCSECGKEVSSQALACPNCGNPIAATETPLPNPPIQPTHSGTAPKTKSRMVLIKRVNKDTKPQEASTLKNLFHLFLLFACLAIPLSFWVKYQQKSEADSASTRVHTSEPELSTANQIANVDIGGYVSPDDSTVKRIAYLLGQVSLKTGESESSIGDKLVYAKNKLHDQYGVNISMLNLLEEAKAAVDESPAPLTFPEVITMLIMQHGG